MTGLTRQLLACTALALPLLWAGLASKAPGQASLRQIHQERSLYRNIIVTEDSTRRCMRFTITRNSGQNQSCRFLSDPDALVFPYAKMVLSSLLVQDNPERILVVGLGGGTLPEVYRALFPEAEIISNEIDEAVYRVARDFFDFHTDERVSVDISDARVFVKRAGLRREQFDLVILDAFNGEYIPEHLMTREFLEEVKAILSPDGMVVANTFSTSRLYDAESVTYQQAFGTFLHLQQSGTGNRVIIATRSGELPDQAQLTSRVPVWQERLQRYGMDLADYPAMMRSDVTWNTGQRPLTDQYAPANLLNQ